jgi:hypothetical protein
MAVLPGSYRILFGNCRVLKERSYVGPPFLIVCGQVTTPRSAGGLYADRRPARGDQRWCSFRQDAEGQLAGCVLLVGLAPSLLELPLMRWATTTRRQSAPSSSGRLGSLILDRKRLSGDAQLTVSISLHCLARFFRRQASNPLARHGDSMAVTGKRLCAPAIQTGARPRPAGNSACRPRSLYGTILPLRSCCA